MKSLRRFARRLTASVLGRREDDRIREELAEHLRLLTDDNVRAGLSFDEARRRASIRLGVGDTITEAHRDEQRLRWLEDVAGDVRYGVRTLRRSPVYATIAVLSLALGIGAAAVMLSLYDAILLRPLPLPDPDRLVLVSQTSGGQAGSISWLNFVDLRDRSQVFDSMSCAQPVAVTVTGLGRARRVDGRMVCANFFDVLGVRPRLGRGFAPGDDHAGAAPVVVVSDRFWRMELHADPDVLGRRVALNGRDFILVGVLPPAFEFLRRDDVFAPLGLSRLPGSGWFGRGSGLGLRGIARLRADRSIEQARKDVERVAADLGREYPTTNAGRGAAVQRVHDVLVGDVRGTINALTGAVAFLLLLTCVNVANLFVGRNVSRQTELTIRVALGCSRFRLSRQLLVEGLLLTLGGCALAVLVGTWLMSLVVTMAPPDVPRLDGLGLNRSFIITAIVVAVACGVLFAGYPTLQASRFLRQPVLVRSARGGHQAVRSTRRALMIVEAVFAVMLLVGCGLMLRTMARLNSVDLGFRSDHLLTGRLLLEGDRWQSPARRMAFFDDVTSRVRALPGVLDVGITLSLPIDGSYWDGPVTAADRPTLAPGELPIAAFVPVSPDYFNAAGIRLLRGRPFDGRDSAQAPRTVVVNNAFASRLWPGESPIGKQLRHGLPGPDHGWEGDWREVVGVVADLKLNGVDVDTPSQVYLPLTQLPGNSVALVVRTVDDPRLSAAAVEDVVQGAAPDVPVASVRSMEDLMAGTLAYRRLSTVVLSMFASVALLLAAVGVYGVVAHAVIDRTPEIGLRMALGAQRGTVVRLVLSEGLGAVLIGAIVGLGLALPMAYAIQHLLFGIDPYDSATFGGAGGTLLLAALLASAIPAYRATRIDPLRALRAE